MKIMITGAAGQLGQALQKVPASHQIVALSHTDLDITNLDQVIREVERHQPDVLINAAAYNDVDAAEDSIVAAYLLNATGPRNLAIATQAHGATIVHVSTDYVFDGDTLTPYHEFSRPAPISAYGLSKLAGEQAVAACNRRHYIARTAWLYGTEGRNFPKTMLSLSGRAEVSVVNNRFGSPTYVPHLAAAIAELITTDTYGIHHLAGGGEASWFSLTEKLFKHFGMTTRVKPVPGSEFKQRARRPDYSVLTTVREPSILLPSWEDGLRQFSQDMLRHPETLLTEVAG
ncbi:MAG TPA: dTDP-4-dehydrorhamnose reductase [Pyrinomonadaceae bacterium]|nr:dTDP-4-dehydrorhamnose reductase [Pyrinomonadaceae bacterium]